MEAWLSAIPSFETASNALNKIGGELGELTGELTNKVQEAIPIDGEDLINKLTLRSDDLVREHELLDAQEKRKELVREYLSEILPWETKDESRAILVEECRTAILNLSKEKSNFETPFVLQTGFMFNATVNNDSDDDDSEDKSEDISKGGDEDAQKKASDENKNDGDDVDKKEDDKKEEAVESKIEKKEIDTNLTAIEISAAKLEKMQPLPLLLEHFDIDTHVGLIERVLKADKGLVDMHSSLSGAGEKELTFWKNYFFHCAYTRYEKGLSVDEIWSSKPKASITDEMTSAAVKANEDSLHDNFDDESSVELEFQQEDSNFDDTTNQPEPLDTTTPGSTPISHSTEEANFASSAVTDDSIASTNSFEIINEATANIDGHDMEDMDDLEAEIARELGEL